MSLALASFSHKTAPVSAREALAVMAVERVLEALRAQGCTEAVVLSTCNRFEVYADGDMCSGGWLADLVERLVGGAAAATHADAKTGEAAVAHLFAVAAGLDSLVVGETEILGQVKTAYDKAKTAGMTSKQFNVLFQRALYVGKKVRSETAIAIGQTSVASVSVQLAESIFGSLAGSSVLILGAGQMAELTARHLLSKKVAQLIIANRTAQRAQALASQLGATPLAWEDFPRALESVDVVVASTGSDKPVITHAAVAAALPARAGRSLFIIDIAMPRDVEDAVHGLEHVYLYRLEDMEAIVSENLSSRSNEITQARAFVDRKAQEFALWARSVAAGSEISLKHSRASDK